MKKKKILLVVGILIGLFCVVGVSYAIWQLTLKQTGTNVVSTGCFNITFEGENDIHLDNAYPMSLNELEDFLSTATPYHFTITNTCESSANAVINLETLGVEGKKLPDEAIVLELFNEKVSNFVETMDEIFVQINNGSLNAVEEMALLKEYLYVYNLNGGIIDNILAEQELNNENKVIPEAIDAYKLYQFILGPKESREFNLLLFMNPDTPAAEEVMNANWKSKITVTSSYMSNEIYEIEKNTILPRYMRFLNPKSIDSNSSTYNVGYDDDFYPFFNNAKRIIFQNTINPIEGVEPIDISQNQTGTVLAYVVEEQNESVTRGQAPLTTVIIQAEGTIYLPKDSRYFFEYSYNLQSIEGLENVNTKNVIYMEGMFANCRSLTTLDLSNFNTEKVTDMSWMFGECSSLTNLNLNGWILKDGIDYNSMFCHVLEDVVNNSGLQNNLTENKDIIYQCNFEE